MTDELHSPRSARRKITVLSPVYNEEASLRRLYDAVSGMFDAPGGPGERYDLELLLVDDGSCDRSAEVMKALREADPRVCTLSLSRNFGKEAALLAGFDYASGDAVVIMDADLQHPVEAVPRMIAEWEAGYDDVYGRRLSRGKESWLRRRLSRAYYSMLQKSSRIDVLPDVGDFRLLDRRCVDALRQLRETQRYTKGLYCWVGYRKKDVPFETADRSEGKSSFSLGGLVNLAVDGITGFTTAPLRFATILGLVVSILSFVYLAVILTKTILWGEPVRGFPTIICAVLFLGGCQLIALGIIGEYIGRIFNETKSRPVYIAESYNGVRQ